MPEPRPNIAFAGLTAAGKTEHAKILAGQLGYEYVSATAIFLEILKIDQPPDKIWHSHYDEIEQARQDGNADAALDSRLEKMAQETSGVLFDTWGLAWTSKASLIRLWIESDLPSRVRKCYVSQGEEKVLSLSDSLALTQRKDTETREKFLRWHGFDLFTDRSKYDIIIDNSDLIPDATQASSEAGILAFTPVVKDTINYQLAVRSGVGMAQCAKLRQDIMNKHEGHILYLR